MEVLAPVNVPTVAPGGTAGSVQASHTPALAAIGNLADHVVTATSESTDPNVRDDDASREYPNERRDRALQTVADIQSRGVTAVMGFNSDANEIYIEMRTSQGDVISRFPSDALSEWMESEGASITANEPGNAAGRSDFAANTLAPAYRPIDSEA